MVPPLLIFTDLDGTLLNAEDYAYGAALPLLEKLKQARIPILPVTSKTRAEVAPLMQTLNLRDPFVVENGSAIFIPLDHSEFDLPEGEDIDSYRLVQLGCSYVMTRAGLKAIAQSLGRPLKGFGDWSIDQVQQMTGLNAQESSQAKAREFTEPFMTPKNVASELLQASAAELGFRVVVGDRFSHCIGAEAGKGQAIARLKHLYRGAAHPLVTIGLGNSPNDLDMLENVDHAIVLPGKNGPHPKLADRGWTIAPAPAPEGWVLAVEELLASLGIQI